MADCPASQAPCIKTSPSCFLVHVPPHHTSTRESYKGFNKGTLAHSPFLLAAALILQALKLKALFRLPPPSIHLQAQDNTSRFLNATVSCSASPCPLEMLMASSPQAGSSDKSHSRVSASRADSTWQQGKHLLFGWLHYFFLLLSGRRGMWKPSACMEKDLPTVYHSIAGFCKLGGGNPTPCVGKSGKHPSAQWSS